MINELVERRAVCSARCHGAGCQVWLLAPYPEGLPLASQIKVQRGTSLFQGAFLLPFFSSTFLLLVKVGPKVDGTETSWRKRIFHFLLRLWVSGQFQGNWQCTWYPIASQWSPVLSQGARVLQRLPHLEAPGAHSG